MDEKEKLEELANKMGYKTYREFKNEDEKKRMIYFGVDNQRPEVFRFISWLMKENRVAVRFSSFKVDHWIFKLEDRFGLGIDYMVFIAMKGRKVEHIWFFKDIWGQKSLRVGINGIARLKEFEIIDEEIINVCKRYGIEGWE